MLNSIYCRMFPITLSKGLAIVNSFKTKGEKAPHWYTKPVCDLIGCIGDKPVRRVKAQELRVWYENLKTRDNERNQKKLSAWTIDSYARAVRSYLNLLVQMGHLERSPWDISLPVLPKTSKNAISDEDVEKMLRVAKRSTRDYALILVLRDSGGRVGELASMTIGNTYMERCYYDQTSRVITLRETEYPPLGESIFWRGRALVMDEKNNKNRWIHFKHDACEGLRWYLDSRPEDAPAALWLSSDDTALTTSGIYQIMQRVGRKAGAKIDNPHAFRHRLAKKLKESKVDPEIIASILGHKSVSTYQAIYGTTEDHELADYHTKFVDW